MKYCKLNIFPFKKRFSHFHQIHMVLVFVYIQNTWQEIKELCIKKELDNWQIGVKAAKKVKHYEKYVVNSCNAYLNLSIANTQNYAVCV